MEIYQSIKKWRKEKGISQTEIAQELEMLQPQYNRYETGKRKYTANMIKKIAIKYNVSADILLGIIE